jgi:Transposase DDE domain
MRLQRIPQRVSTCLFPLSSLLNCPQGQHFRVFCWLLVTLILCQGSATLKNLTRLMPPALRYWTVRRMIAAGYWEASLIIEELATDVLAALPPPADRTLYLIADLTLRQKTGTKMPLVEKLRLNEYARYIDGLSVVLLLAQWGRFRIPVACAVRDPKRKGHQNILFRQMLRRFVPPAWAAQVVVVCDAGFASRPNLRLIQRKGYNYVFALPRTWKLGDGTHLSNLARHLPKTRYRRVASYTPDQRRRDYWVFVRRAELKQLGDVTILLSKRRRNDGPKKIKLIVTNLDSPSAATLLNTYARRWSVEVAFKELKSGLHLGQMQVTSEPERVSRAIQLPVLAYLLLLRLYGRELQPDQKVSLFTLKERFTEEVYQEQLDRSEQKWRKKLDQLKAVA